MDNTRVVSFSSLVTLIFVCQTCALPARPPRSSILRRLLDARSVCAAATNLEINSSIFKQCIAKKTENEIPYEINDFVAMQPSLFSNEFDNESIFRKAVFDKLINPCLEKAEVKFY